MNQEEKDQLSIFMMAQDGRITDQAGRANHFEEQIRMVMRILKDTDLTAAAKVKKLKDKLGMNATNRVMTVEQIAALQKQLADVED